jgi:hypothetical protein
MSVQDAAAIAETKYLMAREDAEFYGFLASALSESSDEEMIAFISESYLVARNAKTQLSAIQVALAAL